MAKVLVTGAEGFIGSHVVEALVRDGQSVRAHVLYNSFNSWGWLEQLPASVMSQVEVFLGDMRDVARTREAVRGTQHIIHLASLIAIPYSYVATRSYVDTNVIGALNVLEAARDMGIERVVHTSTSEVYGSAQRVPMSEDHPVVGQSPYSASKIAADQLAIAYHRSFGVPVVTVRPFNVYGPRQSARAFIPSVLMQLLDGAAHVRVGSLAPTRDLTFVEDTAAGFVSALRAPDIEGEVINLGSGFEMSMRCVVDTLVRLTGARAEIVVDADRVRPAASEVDRLLCDNSKAKRLLGWLPSVSLDEGLRRTVAWFADSANRSGYKSGIYNQ